MHAMSSWSVAAALLLTAVAGDAASLPADFRIRARFFPGAATVDGPRPWRLTITADGKTTQETYSYGPDQTHRKKFQLSSKQVEDIYEALQRAEFFKLPDQIYTPIAGSELGHQMGIQLQIRSHGRTHEVVLDVPGTLRSRAGAKRFWSAWVVISKAVPSPNRNDEFSYWFLHNPL
jgi:hypothetical protein